MARIGKPKLAACTPEDVFRALRKIGGFEIRYSGSKHTKAVHLVSGKCATIPRHAIVNKFLLRDFVGDFLVRNIGLAEEDIYKHLWC
ncbi:MAG: hypothetical protein WDN10_00880 [bacterium]